MSAEHVEVEPYCYVEEGDPRLVADACRAAGVAFVNGVGRGWTKADLARWLVGPYREAARLAPGEPQQIRGPAALLAASVPPGVSNGRLSGLLFDVREHVVRALGSSPDGLVPLPVWARTAGSVLRCVHGNGEAGWVPVDWERMRLVDRVLSLFATDALIRPADYATKLAICNRCASVSFDPRARARGLCEMHVRPTPRSSGVQLVSEAVEAEALVAAGGQRR